jgi:hypothetical protein
MSEIIWNEHIVEGTLNGEKVRFKCKYWSKDIYVEMIEPYQGENESLHIMYMVPRKYDETNWESRAWGLVKKIFERKNWESKNSDSIRERIEEGSRRMEIVAKHVKVLRDALYGVRNEQVSRKTKEQRIKEIKRNIREIEMIAFDEKERCWIYDAMHKKISWKGGLDWWKPPQDKSKIRVDIYLKQGKVYWGDVETWRRVYKIIMDRDDKAVAGIGDEFQHDFSCNDYSTANHIDMDKFKVYLKNIYPFDIHAFDVWEEIGGNGSQWAAVVSKKVI